MNNYNKEYELLKQKTEEALNSYVKSLNSVLYPNLFMSLEYSLLSGGKRVRPVLLLACAKACQVDEQDALPFAAALEMIHAYSLIHDDLPCMDNDDMRRGKPSNHKVFGEGNAVLAGDALLNCAYEVCFKECRKGLRQVEASILLSECAGASGMINGQSADLDAEGVCAPDAGLLNFIYTHKTAKLLCAALAVPAILAGSKHTKALTTAAHYIGLLFQYTDDILDAEGESAVIGKSTGKDKKNNKLTILRMYGLDKAKAEVERLTKECISILDNCGDRFWFLSEFTKRLSGRLK